MKTKILFHVTVCVGMKDIMKSGLPIGVVLIEGFVDGKHEIFPGHCLVSVFPDFVPEGTLEYSPASDTWLALRDIPPIALGGVYYFRREWEDIF